jgi:hypothetical protein
MFGRTKIAAWSQAFLNQFHAQFALDVVEVLVVGNGLSRRADTRSA